MNWIGQFFWRLPRRLFWLVAILISFAHFDLEAAIILAGPTLVGIGLDFWRG